MKPYLFLLLFLTLGTLDAQVVSPQPSPSSSLDQVVGLTQFKIDYSRPSMRGRDVFGGVVPFDELWRTGANSNTTISFDDDISFGNQKVKAGKYALYTKPGKHEWQIYLYDKTDNWGLPEEWNEELIVANISIPSQTRITHKVESFTIDFNHFTKNSAHLILKWDNIAVPIPIEVPTDKKVMASIEKSMKGIKSQDYFNAAVYFLETDRDIKKAKMWIDKAMQMREDKPFWMLRQQSLIYAKAGEKNTAIKLAQQSLEAAEKAGNRDYVRMNKASLKEWGAY